MIKSAKYRAIELFVLFVLVPIQLVIDWSIRARIAIAATGFIYALLLMLTVEKQSNTSITKTIWKQFAKHTLLKFIAIALITTGFVFFTDSERLFNPLKEPKVWLFFIGIYSVVSVLPQEFLYRTFFFKRYEDLFANKNLFLILNAGLFSLGHLFFGNSLVMILTFIGGLLFAYTYHKTKSTLLVIIEHIIYGSWLYTVGMGEMLGFPT